MLRVIALAAVAFASTNIDDIFVLIGFFANRSLSRIWIIVGQYIGIAALTAGALACAALTVAVPDVYIHYLGVLPVLIGLWHLAKQIFGSENEGEARVRAASGTALSVAMVTMSNGADNIAAYVPLFGRQSRPAIILTCIVFAILTGVWCAAGAGLIAHPKLGAILRRGGNWIMPVVLIGLGVTILMGW